MWCGGAGMWDLYGEALFASHGARSVLLLALLRELLLPEGGLASSQDADTDGVEGLTFVWTPAEVDAAARRMRDRIARARRFDDYSTGGQEPSDRKRIFDHAQA